MEPSSSSHTSSREVTKVIQDLPKVELHCHLPGVISPAILRTLRAQGHPILVEPDAVAEVLPIRNLGGFREWIHVLRPYQRAGPELFLPILAQHVSSLLEQNVVYTELMISPAIFPHDRDCLLVTLKRWREWSFDLERGRLQIEYIMVLPRTIDSETLRKDVDNFIALKRAGLIVGVALVGVETGESIARFKESLARCRDAGLGIEIHAGEHSGPASVRDAIQNGLPDRLGHALAAFQHPELLDEIRSRRIHIEFCPTSNLRTAAVEHVEDYPLSKAVRLGLEFSVNTDDPGAFETSISEEYQLAMSLGVHVDLFPSIFRHSLMARFERNLRYISV